MARPRPQTLLLVGPSCCAFAVFYLVWLVLYRGGDLAAVASAAFGNAEALGQLGRSHLVRTAAVRVAVAHFAVEIALLCILAWSGCGLTVLWRSARWSAQFAGGMGIVVALLHSIAWLFFLPAPDETIPLTPLLMDAVAVLFGIVLCGALWLPSVTEAYGGLLEPPTPPTEANLESPPAQG